MWGTPLWGCGSQGMGLATPDNGAYRTASPDNNCSIRSEGSTS